MKFHGDLRELLIGTWKAIEKAGGRPSINAVLTAARDCYGATFRTEDGRDILLSFSDKAKEQREHAKSLRVPRKKNPKDSGTDERQLGNEPGTTFQAQGNIPEIKMSDSGNGLRAHDNVSLFPDPSPSIPDDGDGQASSPKSGKRAKKTTGEPREKKSPPTERPPMPATLPAALPDDVIALSDVARDFLVVFANSKSPEAQEKYSADYTGTLASFRGRGATTRETWDAFADAWLANGGNPLFGAAAKKALNYAPSYKARNSNANSYSPERTPIGRVRSQ